MPEKPYIRWTPRETSSWTYSWKNPNRVEPGSTPAPTPPAQRIFGFLATIGGGSIPNVYDIGGGGGSESRSNNGSFIVYAAIRQGHYVHPVVDGARPPRFVWPTPTTHRHITSRFGYRTHPVTGARQSFHSGIDIRAPIGTHVYAATAGTITSSFWSDSGGHMIIITSNEGVRTRYLHLDCRSLVSVGNTVYQGQHIAFSGNTGRSTGPHLHFDISTQEDEEWIWIDPELFLP